MNIHASARAKAGVVQTFPKDLFDVHSVMTDDPTVALQGAYKAVHSQEVHETYHMDFSESD